MAQSDDCIFRFGSFPINTCPNRIPSDPNVLITYGGVWGRALNVFKRCT